MDRPTAIKSLAESLERQTGRDCTAEAASAITFAEQIEEPVQVNDITRIAVVLPDRSRERNSILRIASWFFSYGIPTEELKTRIWAILGVK